MAVTKRLLSAALAGAILLATPTLTSCAVAVPPGPGSAAGPTSYTVLGDLLLAPPEDLVVPKDLIPEGHECHGAESFSDLGVGAQVKIFDAHDTLVGTGNLLAGKYSWPDGCRMPFTVALVPIGRGTYSVQIGSQDTRGKIAFPESDADPTTGAFPMDVVVTIG